MTMSKQVGNLEEQALKRKEYLKNLKRKFTESKEDDKNGNEKIEIPKPVFRNYRKDDEERKLADEINITEITEVPGVKEQLEEMQTPMEVTDIDIANLAPRKVDFDLKRAIDKKLQKLEKRTQKAISELIRERLNSQNESDFASNVNIGAQEIQKASTHDVDSDD